MANDWIKMRGELWDHPKVVRIVSAICPQSVRDLSARCRVIGALFRTWALADTHTEDGILDGYTAEALDSAVGIDGWAANMQHVGWLIVEPQRLIVPRFTDHSGESAKRRAEDSARKRRVRNLSAKRPQNAGQNADQIREKIRDKREDKNTYIVRTARTSGANGSDLHFDRFWSAFPPGRKKSKGKAREAWAKAIRRADPETIINAAAEYAESVEGRGDYVKMPSTWLNGECWSDDRAAWNRIDAGPAKTDAGADRMSNAEFLGTNQ